MAVMRRIVDDRYAVRHPPYVSPAARDFVSRLLQRKPAKRLGMLQGRAADVRRHRWFDGFDWAALERRGAGGALPPRRPRQEDAARRLRELAEAERGGASPAGGTTAGLREQAPSPQEQAEYDAVFAEF